MTAKEYEFIAQAKKQPIIWDMFPLKNQIVTFLARAIVSTSLYVSLRQSIS